MNIKVITIGNKSNSWELDGIEFYKKQLPRNLKVEFVNIKSQQNSKLTRQEIIESESNQIISKIKKNPYIVAWDKRGDQKSSRDFSNFLGELTSLKQELVFIVGGSYGLSKSILEKSDDIFSASLFTFPHRLFRLLLMEQIYRAHSIINNKPYHK